MIIEMSTHQKNNSVLEIILSSKAFRTTDWKPVAHICNFSHVPLHFFPEHSFGCIPTACGWHPSLRETMWLLLCNENGPALKMWPTVVQSMAEQRRAGAVWTEMAVWSMEELCRRAVKYCAEGEMKKWERVNEWESEWAQIPLPFLVVILNQKFTIYSF